MKKIFFAIFLFLPLSGCAGAAYQLPSVQDSELRLMEEKVASSRKPLKTYERSDKKYRQIVSSITNRLVDKAKPLCDLSEYPECFFQAVYSNEDTVNAFASDGYKITLYRGLLQYLKTDDEIAAVIAHEMGHHLAHHNEETEQNVAAGAAVSGILTAVLLAAANSNNPYYSPYQQQQDSQTVENMMQAGAQIGLISYSKEQEREADLLAAYLLARAGYNLQRAENLLFILGDLPGDKGKSRASLTDTHPASIERLVAWEKAIQEIKSNSTKLPYLKESAAAP